MRLAYLFKQLTISTSAAVLVLDEDGNDARPRCSGNYAAGGRRSQTKYKAKNASDSLGGVIGGGVPPDSIPNSEVKPACGENSAEVARCQNSTMPPFYLFNRKVET